MSTPIRTTAELSSLAALMRLTSPALPIGGFAYSRGLEHAVERGFVHDEASASAWITGLLRHSLAHVDGPVLVRMQRALAAGDTARAQEWAQLLLAMRESKELLLEDEQMGRALVRLLVDLGVPGAPAWMDAGLHTLVAGFALAGVHHGVGEADLLTGYFYASSESQVSAAVRLIPLGQTSGQRILQQVIAAIPDCVTRALACEDDDIGNLAPGLALASAWHETQYSRLFRS